MIIVAFDPGIEKLGYSLFETNGTQHKLVSSGLIKTSRGKKDESRLYDLYKEVDKLITANKPEALVCEKIFFFKNQKTIIPVAQSQGILLLLAAKHNISFSYLAPLQIKQTITGYGNADKISVHKMLKLILKTDLKVADDDESDAIACGLAYCYLRRTLVK